MVRAIGGKARVVTKSPGSLIMLGHYIRAIGL